MCPVSDPIPSTVPDPLADLPLVTRFGMTFALLARRWRRALEAHLAAVGLTDATWAPLVHLKRSGGGITQKELALRVGVDGSSLVRVLDILAREDLIVRRRDESDGRARLIDLTPAGEGRVAQILAELSRAEGAMLADIPAAQIEAMLASFERIDARMSALEAEGGR